MFLRYHFSEVEKQLNKGVPTPQLPNKKSQQVKPAASGSRVSGDLPPPPPRSASPRAPGGPHGSLDRQSDHHQPVLSSFSGGSQARPPAGPGGGSEHATTNPGDGEAVVSQGPQGILTNKSTVVQLRRNTNKQGRQAPTPPRRTR